MKNRRRNIYMWAILGSIVVIVGAVILAPFLTQHSPHALNTANRLKPPSSEYLLGTDMLGRDLFSRILYGGRVSLMVGAVVALLSSVIGIFLGLVAGFNRPLDEIVMRIMDAIMAIPSILLAIALMSLTGASIWNVIGAITVTETPRMVRLVRGSVLSIRERLFIDAAISIGTNGPRLLFKHFLPNLLGPAIVQSTYIFAASMIIEATLSFLGAGVPPDVPSWGSLMAEGRILFQIDPKIVLLPGAILSCAVLLVNLIGDMLRDRYDPYENVK